jgi:D-beta-D-heptose 7-phosphate kinase/D-beta-D-heptose 1-phosphate adenosyltransferase
MPTDKNITGKIITAEEAVIQFNSEFRKDRILVFTNGCFDLLHKGHIHSLIHAKALGDLLIVGLNSDASVTRLKGPSRPVCDQQSRTEQLGALSAVDYIIIFHEDTPLDLIRTLKPDVLAKGGDYKKEEIVGYQEVKSYGGRVETIPLLEGYSTSSIIDNSI